MLVTIHGLPPNMRYTDVKALLKNKCGLMNVILDNLVSEGNTKQVTVGLADEGDAAILVRKINGLYLNGCQLYIEDVRKKQPSDQPYRSSSYQQPARELSPEPEFRNPGAMQQQMMMQQMMGQASMARMYAAQTCQIATPQAPIAPYAAPTVQAYFVPVQPASYGVSDNIGNQSYDLGKQSYVRGNQGYDRGNEDYDLGNQNDRGNVNKSFDRGSSNQSYDRGNTSQSYRGNAGQSTDRPSFDRGNVGQSTDSPSFDRGNAGQSTDRPRFDRGNAGRSTDRQSFDRGYAGPGTDRPGFDRGNAGQSTDRQSFDRGYAGPGTDRPGFDRGNAGQSTDRPVFDRGNAGQSTNRPDFNRGNAVQSIDRGNPAQSFDRVNRGSINQSYDRSNPQSFIRVNASQSADRGNNRPSFDRGNPGQSFSRGNAGPKSDRGNFTQGVTREHPIPGFDRSADQSFDRGDVSGNQSYERGNPSYDRGNQSYERDDEVYDLGFQSLDRGEASFERGQQAFDRGDEGYDNSRASLNLNQAYDRGLIDRPSNASFDRNNITNSNQVDDRPSDSRYRQSLSPRSRPAGRANLEPEPYQSRWDQKRKREPSPPSVYPDRNAKRYQPEPRSAERPSYGEPSTGRIYPDKQGFNRDPGYGQSRPSDPPYSSQVTQRPEQPPRGPPKVEQFPGRNAPRQSAPRQSASRQSAPKQEPFAPRQSAPNPRQNAPFVPKQNAPFSKKNAAKAARFAQQQNAPKPNAPPPTFIPKAELNAPFPTKMERRLPPIPNPNQPPPREDKINRWCKWGASLVLKDIRRKVHLKTFTPLETKIILQQLRKAFMVVCKKQWPPSKWWLVEAYNMYYGVPGSYHNFIQTTLGKIAKGVFVLEEEPTRPKKVKVINKRANPPHVQELLQDPYQGMDPADDVDFEPPVKKEKPTWHKSEPINVPKVPVLKQVTEGRLPRFPNADKQVFRDIKKLLVREVEGEELYHLQPDQKAALREELDKIMEIAKAQCQDAADELDSKICEYLTQEAFPEFDKSLHLTITKRILNIRTGLSFRIFFEPKPPNKDVLHAFLKQYGVISARKSDLKKFWIADVKDYDSFDKLCGISSVNLDGCTLKFKPLNLAGPSEKDIKKGKNALRKEQQQLAKKLKNQQTNKLQMGKKAVVTNQPKAGTSKVKTENVKTEKNAPKYTPTYGLNTPQIPDNVDFTEDNFDHDISSKNINDFVLVDECNDDEEIPAPTKAEELEELEDFNLEVDEEDLEDYDL